MNIKDFCFSRRLQTFIDRHGIKFEDVLLAVRNAAEQQQQQQQQSCLSQNAIFILFAFLRPQVVAQSSFGCDGNKFEFQI